MARWSTRNYPLTTWSHLPYNKPKAQPLKLRLRTRTTYHNPFRACTGFDGGFEVAEAIRSLPNCVITGNSKYKRWRSVSNGSLSAARQSCCTHTSGVWRRPCEKPCRVSFAPADVLWSYWSSKPVGGRAAEGMLIQRLWWEMPQGIDFRTRVQFPPGPLKRQGCLLWHPQGKPRKHWTWMFSGLFSTNLQSTLFINKTKVPKEKCYEQNSYTSIWSNLRSWNRFR